MYLGSSIDRLTSLFGSRNMDVDILSLCTFALITTFTPGPNTISCASMGLTYGYRRSLGYMLGIATGFFLVMLASSLLSAYIQLYFPKLLMTLSYGGSLYILYLAYHIFRSGYAAELGLPRPMGYLRGLALQVLNPKVVILGLTVYSTFLLYMPHTWSNITLSALGFTLMSFAAVSTWARFGSLIGLAMQRTRTRRAMNAILSLLLVYSAVRMAASTILG